MALVLVIDDDPDVLVLCRLNLVSVGHEVRTALDAEGGLELARADRPDVIVLDLMLPGRDGFEVLQELAQDEGLKDIPVLVLTAMSRLEERERALRAGATQYMTKPFSPVALTEALDRLSAMTPDERLTRRAEALSALPRDRA